MRTDLPERWQHSRAVADRAAELADAVPAADRAVLIATAWLHDIGYAPGIRTTGFHPLDGALHLRLTGWPTGIVRLVAHRSSARFVAGRHDLAPLITHFPFTQDAVSDALTYADQTVGQWGRRMNQRDRIHEAISRHGPESATTRARTIRVPYLLAAADRVEQRLSATQQIQTGDRLTAARGIGGTSNSTPSGTRASRQGRAQPPDRLIVRPDRYQPTPRLDQPLPGAAGVSLLSASRATRSTKTGTKSRIG